MYGRFVVMAASAALLAQQPAARPGRPPASRHDTALPTVVVYKSPT